MGVFLALLITVAVVFLIIVGGASFATYRFARHIWRELRKAPAFQEVARGAQVARPFLVYRDALRRAPLEATQITLRIDRKVRALGAVGESLPDEQRFRLEETTARYLPDTMEAYRKALVGADLDQRREVSAMLLEQLNELDQNLDRIAASAGETGLAALRANGAFLDQISSDIQDDQRKTG